MPLKMKHFTEEKMALTINTNLFSLNTQKNLQNSQQPLATAMQRLSSGLRINSAKDDAAGLAIATRMSRQITGLAVAARNANDGISFAQTAEGTMTEMVNDLQRIYELSNQAASYNTSLDRSSMNQEVQQLISELNRVVSQTRFNGTQFLNQQFSANFQVGTEVNETINITTSNVAPNAFGVQASQTDFTNSSANLANIASAAAAMTISIGSGTALASSATLGGVSLGAAILASAVINNSQAIINRVNQYSAQTNITAFSFGNADIGTTAISVGTTGGLWATAGTANISAGYLTINGIAIGSLSVSFSTAGSSGFATAYVAALANAINSQTSQTGVTAEVVSLGTTVSGSQFSTPVTTIALVNTTGNAITVSVATANVSVLSSAGATITGSWSGMDIFANASIAAGQNGQIIYSSPLNTSQSVSLDSNQTGFALGIGTTTVSMSNSQSINNISVTTTGNANLSILAVEQGLETMNSQKAYLGAILNRFQSTIRSIDNVSENITAARSRIMDADFAAETANLTKAMITQQAGISVLAQANTIPQQVLTLLSGR